MCSFSLIRPFAPDYINDILQCWYSFCYESAVLCGLVYSVSRFGFFFFITLRHSVSSPSFASFAVLLVTLAICPGSPCLPSFCPRLFVTLTVFNLRPVCIYHTPCPALHFLRIPNVLPSHTLGSHFGTSLWPRRDAAGLNEVFYFSSHPLPPCFMNSLVSTLSLCVFGPQCSVLGRICTVSIPQKNSANDILGPAGFSTPLVSSRLPYD